MILGVDVSTYPEELDKGARFLDGDTPVDPLNLFRANGVDYMRIRLWHTPYAENGVPYLAGTNDLPTFLRLGKLAVQKGFRIVLDIHYSDFWADPGKQCPPKAWAGFDFSDTEAAVYRYTVDVLKTIRENGLDLAYIQIGNEITNGMLWPHGKLTDTEDGVRGNYPALCRLLNAGAKGCREVFPETKLILHLERSHDAAVYEEFFTQMQKYGVDYDVIGASYYPYWHGSFAQFFANMDNCRKFGKQRMVMELGYAFTMESYLLNGNGTRLVIGKDTAGNFSLPDGYPLTPEGQAAFVKEFLHRAEQHGLDGVFYWEPLWIPGDGICWASPEGQDYIGESGKSTLNEWANQCMFDYSGHKLPVFDAFRTTECSRATE